MKKSELKQLIKEEIINHLKEQSIMTGMKHIPNLTPEIESKIKNLKNLYPKHEFYLTSNDRWKPDRKDLYGTYTFSYSGPKNDELRDIINHLK